MYASAACAPMDGCPFGSAICAALVSWVKVVDRIKEISKNPRLPVSRGFFVEPNAAETGGTTRKVKIDEVED
jgi:hypothetical protein